MERDVVCGMQVHPSKEAGTSQYKVRVVRVDERMTAGITRQPAGTASDRSRAHAARIDRIEHHVRACRRGVIPRAGCGRLRRVALAC